MSEDELENAYRALTADLERFIARRVPTSDVDDILQDTFEQALTRLHTLRDDERLVPWIYRIAHHKSVDLRRRQQARPEPVELDETRVGSSGDESTPALPGEPDPEALEEMLGSWLRMAIADLPEEYREAMELVEIEGLSQAEVAKRTGLSPSGARSRVQRGRKLLAQRLHSCCHVQTDARGRVIDVASRKNGCC